MASRRPARVRFSDRVEDSRLRTGQAVASVGPTPGAEVVTCLPLQMAVYFNVFYVPLWAAGSILALHTKFSLLVSHYRYVSVLVMVVMLFIEAGRLYLAYEGNLREKVAEMAGFWLLSLLQTPLTLYTLANTASLPLPLDFALSIPLLFFLSAELLLGLWTLYRLVGSQALKFHLAQNSGVLLTHNTDSSGTDNVGTEGDIEMTQLQG